MLGATHIPASLRVLIQLKNNARLVYVDVDLMLGRSAPENAGEIKHRQKHEQKQHDGQYHHCTTAAAIRVNVFYYMICHRSILRLVVVKTCRLSWSQPECQTNKSNINTNSGLNRINWVDLLD
jgi:hypothetical protein